ncbi:unnamed protein product [Peniophora sp. CBMAI 1063]|nr:unnamed protein product [Peniophora sp. CBMAI 1063]
MVYGAWAWNGKDLDSVLRRMTSSQMRCWIQREDRLSEMIALTSSLLYHGVLHRSTSSRPVSVIESLPIEVIEEILLYAGSTSLRTRCALQLVCRMFRCIVILSSAFYSDLASMPVHPPAFFASFNRACIRDRPFYLVFDADNRDERSPPLLCLLTGVPLARTIIINHTVPVGDVVEALIREESCDFLTKLVLMPVGSAAVATEMLSPLRGPDRQLSIRAPNLTHLELYQMNIVFPASNRLRSLKIDYRAEQDMFTRSNAFHPTILHSILSRNAHLEHVTLTSPLGLASLANGPTSSIALPSMKTLKLETDAAQPITWLLPCLVLPQSAYLLFKVGENSARRVDVSSLVGVLGKYTATIILVMTLTGIHSIASSV